MYGIYANIWGILMVNVTIYGIHGSYGIMRCFIDFAEKTMDFVFWPRKLGSWSNRCFHHPNQNLGDAAKLRNWLSEHSSQGRRKTPRTVLHRATGPEWPRDRKANQCTAVHWRTLVEHPGKWSMNGGSASTSYGNFHPSNAGFTLNMPIPVSSLGCASQES